jgi:adenine deaminase
MNVALGKEKATLVIKNANIVNVFTKEIVLGDIAIYKDLIVGIGKYTGKKEIDAKGKYICPGLIDSHVHIESSMVTPSEFARSILPFGTTTIIADPHEIANVCGINGIHYMLNQTKHLPMNVYIMIPSCVPATPFEDNGAYINAEAMEPLKGFNRILGLGEVMDFVSLLNGDINMLKKVDLFDHAIIDGHSPSLTGNELNAYKAIGVLTDHECSTPDEALERLRLGMYVQIREGSAAKNLENIVKGLLNKGINLDKCLFCTDDKHLEDIRSEGHISYNIKKAISCGLDPIEAICMSTINASRCYKLKRLGAVAPGYSADLLMLNDLRNFDIEKVLYRGQVVVDSGSIIGISTPDEDKNVTNTVRIPYITGNDLAIPMSDDNAVVIRILPNELITKKENSRTGVKDGFFVADKTHSKLAVIERHKSLGKIGLGIVKGFNIENGAIASTVAHDSHNLIVIGDNDNDMLLAINEIKRANGGFTVVGDGKVLGILELPIAGLMSNRSAAYVESKLAQMIETAHKLGVNPEIDPFTTLSFLALPVIPEIRVTDQGLFDVTEFKFIKLCEK